LMIRELVDVDFKLYVQCNNMLVKYCLNFMYNVIICL